ncbi:MAG TPA: DUF1559 domain-containing protein, partial [Gemmatales bacterium]|nr:DUF1559 domain-containing protein [Gemmatales bacterium]
PGGTGAQGTCGGGGAWPGGAAAGAEPPEPGRLYQAIIRYRDEHGHFPPAASLSPEGEPLLSWRVLILPQLGEEGLYKQFKLDEPWHSPHNKRLLARKPAAYGREFNRGERSRMLTPYVTGMGPGVILDARHQTKEADLKAGPSVIALLVERTGFDEGVLWTKPEDLDLASEQPLVDALVPTWHHSFKVLFADGKVRKLRKEGMDDRKLRALFRRDHQEKVEWKD